MEKLNIRKNRGSTHENGGLRPVLSVCLPTISERREQFSQLVTELEHQRSELRLCRTGGVNKYKLSPWMVELLFTRDNKELSIGSKRQELVERAQGWYVCMIDDDDWISPRYLADILSKIFQGFNKELSTLKYEHIGFRERVDLQLAPVTWQRGYSIISNRFDDWEGPFENRTNLMRPYIWHRTPNPKSVILADIVKEIGYKDMRYGEDHDFSKRLKKSGLIVDEGFIDKELYLYNRVYSEHGKRYGIK